MTALRARQRRGLFTLNLESLLTVLLAWFVFGEHFDRRIASAWRSSSRAVGSCRGRVARRFRMVCTRDRRCLLRLGARQQPDA